MPKEKLSIISRPIAGYLLALLIGILIAIVLTLIVDNKSESEINNEKNVKKLTLENRITILDDDGVSFKNSKLTLNGIKKDTNENTTINLVPIDPFIIEYDYDAKIGKIHPIRYYGEISIIVRLKNQQAWVEFEEFLQNKCHQIGKPYTDTPERSFLYLFKIE